MDWRGRKRVFVSMLKKKQFRELKRLVLRRLYINCIMRPLGFPFALFLIPSLYLIEPFFKIRISAIPISRIGHLAIEPELFLRRQRLEISPLTQGRLSKDNYFFVTSRAVHTYKIANRQLLEMFKRNLRIFDSYFASWLFFSMEWLLSRTRFGFGLPHNEDGDSDYVLKNTETTLTLSEEEEEEGEKFLRQVGVDPSRNWFVCVFSRDTRYLSQNLPNVDWSYHDWRNADIDTFIPAVEYIINKGGYVFRMGSNVEKAMSFQHERFIDYAMKYRTDFLDIFLVAKCRFFLGTTSGICDVATVMNKPRVVTNLVPLGYVVTGRDVIYIPKKIRNRKNKKFFTMSEVLEKRLDCVHNAHMFLGGKYEYEDNTADEILEITQEMIDRLDGVFKISEDDSHLMREYFSLFKPVNYSHNVGNTVGKDFLRKNCEVFF